MNISRQLLIVASIVNNSRISANILKQGILRCYSHNVQHRNPRKVFSSDGETELDPNGKSTVQDYSKDGIKGVIELTKDNEQRNGNKFKRSINRNYKDQLEEYDNEESNEILGTHFVRLSDSQLSKFSNMVSKTQAKKQREKSQLIMLEGKRLIQDAILAGVIPLEIYFNEKSMIEELTMPPGVVKLYKLPYRRIKLFSQLCTPPGIVAFCRIPKEIKLKKDKNQNSALPITVICDNVREPGNLGSIIRTVAAVGCSEIIMTEGCTDLWDPKVLRAGCGGHFRINVKRDVPWAEMGGHIEKGAKIFLADNQPARSASYFERHSVSVVPYFSVNYSSLTDQIVIVFGGETYGLSEEAFELARYRGGVKINIPLENEVESLSVNAATSTILFEIKRQILHNIGNKELFVANN